MLLPGRRTRIRGHNGRLRGQNIAPALLAAQAALESSTKVNAAIARMRIDERRLELAERDRRFVREIITAALILFGIPASDERLAEIMPRAIKKAELALVAG